MVLILIEFDRYGKRPRMARGLSSLNLGKKWRLMSMTCRVPGLLISVLHVCHVLVVCLAGVGSSESSQSRSDFSSRAFADGYSSAIGILHRPCSE